MYFNGTPLPGLLISGQDTYETWEMIPTSRLYVAKPEVKTAYVDLPGADGGLDYTELLTGEPKYGYRKGTWEFMLIPGDQWANVYRNLSNYLHGREHTVILQGDPNYKYTGRLQINEWQSNAHNSIIKIDYILDPKAKNAGSQEDEQTAGDLAAAGRLLRKPANSGKIIKLDGSSAVLATPASLFEDGDMVDY